MTGARESLWYDLQSDSGRSGISVVATHSPAGIVELSCTSCGYTFISGKPFTGESDEVDAGLLARVLYYHRCDMGPRKASTVKRRG